MPRSVDNPRAGRRGPTTAKSPGRPRNIGNAERTATAPPGNARLAQLAEASHSKGEGSRFDSGDGHQVHAPGDGDMCRAFVAQLEVRRSPKPEVAGSSPAERASP